MQSGTESSTLDLINTDKINRNLVYEDKFDNL